MAAISGKKGTVFLGSVPVLRLNSWSLDIDSNMLDITSWTTGTDLWRSFTPGLNAAAGSVSGHWDAVSSTAQNDMQGNILTPASATVVLEVDQDAGGKYSGTAYLSRQSVNVDIDGVPSIAWDVQYDGAVTFTTTT